MPFIRSIRNTLQLSLETKTVLSGIFLIGVPEIFGVISIIILGKSGFDYIKSKEGLINSSFVIPGEAQRRSGMTNQSEFSW
jgi:hypothetical protein